MSVHIIFTLRIETCNRILHFNGNQIPDVELVKYLFMNLDAYIGISTLLIKEFEENLRILYSLFGRKSLLTTYNKLKNLPNELVKALLTTNSITKLERKTSSSDLFNLEFCFINFVTNLLTSMKLL